MGILQHREKKGGNGTNLVVTSSERAVENCTATVGEFKGLRLRSKPSQKSPGKKLSIKSESKASKKGTLRKSFGTCFRRIVGGGDWGKE